MHKVEIGDYIKKGTPLYRNVGVVLSDNGALTTV